MFYLRDHLAPCFVPFPVTSFLLARLYHSLARGAIFQRELGDDPRQFLRFGERYTMQGNAEP